MWKKRRSRWGSLAFLITPVCALAAVLLLFTAVANLQDGQGAESRRQLEDSLRRAVVTCYATEGIYPPTLDYLEEHYGVTVDERRFTVFYEIFAENQMPDITVLPG